MKVRAQVAAWRARGPSGSRMGGASSRHLLRVRVRVRVRVRLRLRLRLRVRLRLRLRLRVRAHRLGTADAAVPHLLPHEVTVAQHARQDDVAPGGLGQG